MKNITTNLVLVLSVAVVLSTQVYASETTETSEVITDNETECQVLLNKESRISNFLHKCPIISLIVNKKANKDYVVEDTLLTNYMMGTPAEAIARMTTSEDKVAEEEMLEKYMLSSDEIEDTECIAEASDTEDILAEHTPVAFAADFDEEVDCSEGFDFFQIDYFEEDLNH